MKECLPTGKIASCFVHRAQKCLNRALAVYVNHWTTGEWKMIVWTDDFRFCLHYFGGRVRVRHFTEGNILTKQAVGGNITAWAIISWNELSSSVIHCTKKTQCLHIFKHTREPVIALYVQFLFIQQWMSYSRLISPITKFV